MISGWMDDKDGNQMLTPIGQVALEQEKLAILNGPGGDSKKASDMAFLYDKYQLQRGTYYRVKAYKAPTDTQVHVQSDADSAGMITMAKWALIFVAVMFFLGWCDTKMEHLGWNIQIIPSLQYALGHVLKFLGDALYWVFGPSN